jgi:hypothetical protein
MIAPFFMERVLRIRCKFQRLFSLGYSCVAEFALRQAVLCAATVAALVLDGFAAGFRSIGEEVVMAYWTGCFDDGPADGILA